MSLLANGEYISQVIYNFDMYTIGLANLSKLMAT